MRVPGSWAVEAAVSLVVATFLIVTVRDGGEQGAVGL